MYCPSDIYSPVGNELSSPDFSYYRSSYRGCSGSGDIYGNATDNTTGPWGIGALGIRKGQNFDAAGSVFKAGARMNQVTDGTSKTILLSEGIVSRSDPYNTWGGPIGEAWYGNMGGGVFSAATTPNSSTADRPYGPCPQDVGDSSYLAPCISLGNANWWQPNADKAFAAARSKHPGGVNTTMVDGSVTFFSEQVDLLVWRALGTRAGGEVFQMP
jgi:prepilin-type processing-associated H-X9-DG protein